MSYSVFKLSKQIHRGQGANAIFVSSRRTLMFEPKINDNNCYEILLFTVWTGTKLPEKKFLKHTWDPSGNFCDVVSGTRAPVHALFHRELQFTGRNRPHEFFAQFYGFCYAKNFPFSNFLSGEISCDFSGTNRGSLSVALRYGVTICRLC